MKNKIHNRFLMGYKVFNSDLKAILFHKKAVINTINPHSYCVSLDDNFFRESLEDSDFLIPDGIGICLAFQYLFKKQIKKITGADLHSFFLKHLNSTNGKAFYLGASDNTLIKIKERVKKEHPKIDVKFYSPPFKKEFNQTENNIILKEINQYNPDVLFVGMTAPKQEKWVHRNKEKINVNYICSIGAVFDFYSRKSRRAPKFVQKIGLEWLFRSLMSFRLARRNLTSNPRFIYHILKFKYFENSFNHTK